VVVKKLLPYNLTEMKRMQYEVRGEFVAVSTLPLLTTSISIPIPLLAR
jgi:hypothetical protein